MGPERERGREREREREKEKENVCEGDRELGVRYSLTPDQHKWLCVCVCALLCRQC